jgi:hypothetical protein
LSKLLLYNHLFQSYTANCTASARPRESAVLSTQVMRSSSSLLRCARGSPSPSKCEACRCSAGKSQLRTAEAVSSCQHVLAGMMRPVQFMGSLDCRCRCGCPPQRQLLAALLRCVSDCVRSAASCRGVNLQYQVAASLLFKQQSCRRGRVSGVYDDAIGAVRALSHMHVMVSGATDVDVRISCASLV